jgi:hypothetical protein
MLVYGMGELPLLEILPPVEKAGCAVFARCKTIAQTAVLLPAAAPVPKNQNWDDFTLHSHEECLHGPRTLRENFKDIETESNRVKARRLLQRTVNACSW